jgi:hypothetical protein
MSERWAALRRGYDRWNRPVSPGQKAVILTMTISAPIAVQLWAWDGWRGATAFLALMGIVSLFSAVAARSSRRAELVVRALFLLASGTWLLVILIR